MMSGRYLGGNLRTLGVCTPETKYPETKQYTACTPLSHDLAIDGFIHHGDTIDVSMVHSHHIGSFISSANSQATFMQ